jgi:hypothetical protein
LLNLLYQFLVAKVAPRSHSCYHLTP